MIYTDRVHLITDGDISELHMFAGSLGLRREWFQDHPCHPHYDLTTARMAEKAVRAGANVVNSRTLIKILKKRKF